MFTEINGARGRSKIAETTGTVVEICAEDGGVERIL